MLPMAMLPLGAPATTTTYSIANSLRFDGSNDYLSRTFGTCSANGRRVWTFSAWVKRSALGANQQLIGSGTGIAGGGMALYFSSTDDTLRLYSGSVDYKVSSAKYRDPSAWMHVVWTMDALNTVTRIYVNGAEISYSTNSNPSNADQSFNAAVAHSIGANTGGSYPIGGYMADVYFVDGYKTGTTLATASDFAETNADGVWVPKAYSGSYGNNGFHLDYKTGSDATALGYDHRAGSFSENLRASGTNIGSLTLGGGLAAAFDSSINDSTTCAYATSGLSTIGGYVGKNWGTAKTLTGFVVRSCSNDWICNQNTGQTITFTLEGSATGAFAGEEVNLGSTTATDSNTGGCIAVKSSGLTASAYQYHRIKISAPLTFFGGGCRIGEVEFYEAGSYAMGNNWFPNGMTRAAGVNECWMTDTPTNNYCTGNPLARRAAVGTITWSEANLRATNSSASGDYVFGSQFVSSGVWWDEITITTVGTNCAVGVDNEVRQNDVDTNSVVYLANGNKAIGASTTAYGSSYTTGDVIGRLLNKDANTVTFYKQTAGAGNFVSQGAISLPTNVAMMFFANVGANGGSVQLNSGQRTFNYVTQHGSLPSSAKALCTANLPAVTITNPSNGIKVTRATATNIDANVATTRSGWPAYLDIKKDMSAAVSWQFQFSHDSTKQYTSNAGFTYGAIASNSGADSYVGYSIRIDSAYGTAAGSVAFTTGADATITHNVSKSARQIIILFSRSASTVYMYHPDCTAGSLLRLDNGALGEGASTAIKSVTSSSFQIGSAMASATYDYLVVQEMAGLFKTGYHTANNVADGTFSFTGLSSLLEIFKSKDATARYSTYDYMRDTYNTANHRLIIDVANGEAAAEGLHDDTAGGYKCRDSGAPLNSGSVVYLYSVWGRAFGGSNVSPSPAR